MTLYPKIKVAEQHTPVSQILKQTFDIKETRS
jgi:hypothetical protein